MCWGGGVVFNIRSSLQNFDCILSQYFLKTKSIILNDTGTKTDTDWPWTRTVSMFDTDMEIDRGRDMGLVHVRIHGLSLTALKFDL